MCKLCKYMLSKSDSSVVQMWHQIFTLSMLTSSVQNFRMSLAEALFKFAMVFNRYDVSPTSIRSMNCGLHVDYFPWNNISEFYRLTDLCVISTHKLCPSCGIAYSINTFFVIFLAIVPLSCVLEIFIALLIYWFLRSCFITFLFVQSPDCHATL